MTATKIDKKKLGIKIKNIRLSLGMSQSEFGDLFNPSADKSIVSRWEKGQSIPSAERIKNISELSNVPIDELIYGNLKEALLSLIKQAQRLFDKYGYQTSETLSNITKDNDDLEKVTLLFSLAAFKHNNYYLTPRPLGFKKEFEDRTEQDAIDIDNYFKQEDEKGTQAILEVALEEAQNLSLKATDELELLKILSQVAEYQFSNETYDNAGLVNFVKNNIFELFENKIYHFANTCINIAGEQKYVLRRDIDKRIIEDFDKLYDYISEEIEIINNKYL